MADKQAIIGEQALRALTFLNLGPSPVKATGKNEAPSKKQVGVTVITSQRRAHKRVASVQPKGKGTSYVMLKFSVHNEPLLPGDAIRRLAQKLFVDEKVVLDASRIPERTFHRRQEKQELLTATESDRVMRIARVGAEAGRVFGNEEKAARWLSKINRMLGAKPLDLLASDAGSREVEAELQRIDFGDFA